MIIDFLLNLVDSWLQGVASILPTFSFGTIGQGQEGLDWLNVVFEHLAYFQTWGIPVSTFVMILSSVLTMEILYGTVLLITFIYNRVRGA